MRIARFEKGGFESYGIIEKSEIIEISGSIFDENVRLAGSRHDLNGCKLLSPCSPTKIVCVGLNYTRHAEELKLQKPEEPVIFIKPSTSVIGPGENIVYPGTCRQLDYEAELALVVKKTAKNVARDRVNDYILGYTCFNDVTARDLQKKDGQWTRAKSFDTFSPIGPYVETDVNPKNITVEAYLNGQKKQSGNTRDMIFDAFYLLCFVSSVMTLLPGDVIATGTPEGVGPMKTGDSIEIRVEGIGSLINKVVV